MTRPTEQSGETTITLSREEYESLAEAVKIQTQMLAVLEMKVGNLHLICSKLAKLASSARTMPQSFTPENIGRAREEMIAHQDETSRIFDMLIASIGGENVAD